MTKKHYIKKTVNGKVYDYYRRQEKYRDRKFEGYAKNSTEWHAQFEAFKKDVDSSFLTTDPKMTVSQLADLFLDDARATKRPSTIQERVLNVDKYIVPAIGHLKLRDVKNEHCEKVLERPSTPSMVEHCHKVLKRMFQFAIENELVITISPISLGLTKRVKSASSASRQEQEPKPDFSLEMMMDVLAEFKSQPYEVMGHWLFLHGLRIGEALGISWTDVDFDGGWINVTKQASSVSKVSIRGSRWDTGTPGPLIIPPKTESSKRKVPLTQPTRALLLKTPEKERNGFIFSTRNGNPHSASNFRRQVWYPLIKRLDLDWLDSHDLRKAFGSFLLDQTSAGYPIVSKWMGHSDPSVTLAIYAKPVRESEMAHKDDMGLAFPMR